MNDLFLRVCHGEVAPRPPVWVMRQAGRYLPAYREVRAAHSFLEVATTPSLAAEVTLQPLREFAFDAAIVFSDIMMPLLSLGIDLVFNPGPVLSTPIRTPAQVEALRLPDKRDIAPYVNETIKLLRKQLQVPLIGFAGAPLTLAAYLIEGKGSKDFTQLRIFMYKHPKAFAELLQKLAALTKIYLQNQIDAGAQAVQVFDSWAGMLPAEEYGQFVLPVMQEIFASLATAGVPRIFFANQASHLWEVIKTVEVEVFGVDWRTPLNVAAPHLKAGTAIQGNLDPTALFAPEATLRARIRQVLQAAHNRPHIFNLGHGILPETPVASVHTLLDEIKYAK